MPSRLLILAPIALTLAGCATSSAFSPQHAVMKAAAAPESGVAGTFAFTVKAVGRQSGMVFLNSESDYRDQRCLTVAMSEALAAELSRRLGAKVDEYLVGKKITVRGTARRVRIGFFADGRPTDKYYYQTHVLVASSDQLSIVRS